MRKVNLKDVKISLLKERIEKAKLKQLEVQKGYSKYVNPQWDAQLNDLVKFRKSYKTMKVENDKFEAKLSKFHDID